MVCSRLIWGRILEVGNTDIFVAIALSFLGCLLVGLELRSD